MITIILLSRDTSQYLKRALDYYKTAGFKGRIFIADSSSSEERIQMRMIVKEFQSDLFFPIIFEYDNATTFTEKVGLVVKQVCTPYVLLASMDDFFSVQTLREGAFFLCDNPDYSFVAGYQYGYTYVGTDLDWYYTGDSYHPRSIAQENSLERIDSYLVNYTSTFHSLFRTAVLDSVLEQSMIYANDFCGKFLENMVTILALLSGKGKYLKVPFSWREQRKTSTGAKYHEKWLLDENFEKNARLMELGIKNALEQALQLDSKTADFKSKIIIQKFIEYHFNCIFPHQRVTGFSVKRLIKQFAPVCVLVGLKQIKKAFNAIKRSRLSGECFLYEKSSSYYVEFELVNNLIKDSKIHAYRSGIEDLKMPPKIIKGLRSDNGL